MTTEPKWARLGPLYISREQAELAEQEGRAIRIFPEGLEALEDYQLPGVGAVPKKASAKMMGSRLSEVGTFPTSGVVDMDANPRLPPDVWRGFQTRIGVVDQMRQEDPIIKAITLAYCLPIIRSHWKVEPGGDDRVALEEAEFIRANFFEYLKGGFYQFVEQAASAVWRGFSLFEIVAKFDRETKMVRLDQLSPMLPRTVYQWTRYPDAGWGCTQTSYTGDPDLGSTSSLSDLGPSLPPEKLLHFVFDPDGDAPEGTSILRPCYGGWKARRLYLKLEASGFERSAFGIPYVEVAPTARAGDSATVNTILRELRTGSRAWASFPPGYTLKFADFPMKGADIREARRALGQDMARAALAPFITTGDGKVGSFALIQGQQDFFTMTLQSAADMIGKVLSHGSASLVQRLCMWNYERTEGFPRIVPGSISIGDPAALVNAIKTAADAGALIPDRGIEESVRAALGLPEMPEVESKEEMEHRLKNDSPPEVKEPAEPAPERPAPKVAEVTDDQADDAKEEGEKMEALAELPGMKAISGRDLRPYEMVVRLDETLAPMQGAKQAMAQAAVNWRNEIAEKYAQRVSRAGDLIEMRSVDVPDVGKLKEMFKAELRKVYRSGQASVREEMDRMEAAPDLARAVEDGDFETTRDGIVVESPEEVRVLQEPHACCPHHSLQETKPGSKADDADQSTPAAPDERRTGSKKNEPGSASTEGKGIDLGKNTELALERKVKAHNEAVGDDKSKRATNRMLKAVYRRGSGAFSTSHRPGMSRGQWSMGRVNAFLRLLRTGRPADAKYITDNDLLPKGHPRATRDE
jgi:hypothetical protein